jgi:tight adherence protein B
VLLVEGAFLYWRDVKGPNKRLSLRMQLVAAGASSQEMLAALRRDAPAPASGLLAPMLTYLEARLTQAGSRVSARRMQVLMLAMTCAIGIGVPLVGRLAGQIQSFGAVILILVFAVAIGVGAPLIVLNASAAKRIKLFEQQFPVALDIFVRGLRAGYPVTAAFELLVAEIADPLASEFGLVVAEMNYGCNLREALANLARRVQTQDTQMFVVSVAIQTETGGSLADILDGLSRVIRDRASMVLKVRALASEGKMTAMLLSVLPVAAFCMTFARQPSYYLDVVGDAWFMPGVLAILGAYACGMVLMKRMIRLKV